MGPTLAQAKDRRWWIAITSIIENLLFAAVLLGWSSLLLMIKNEGFFSSICLADNSSLANETAGEGNYTQYTTTNNTYDTKEESIEHTHSTGFKYPTCQAQDAVLNLYFTIGSSLLSGVTVILGVIMDKYGCRYMRLCGTLTFVLSCVFFIIGSNNTEEYSFLIAPAVCFNGMGGVVYVFTSFQVPNLFEDIRSTMIALMIGSYSASAIVYMVFKAFYDMGVSFQTLMIIHGSIGVLTFFNCYFNIPMEAFPGPDDISYAIRFKHREMRYDHKVSGKKFLVQSASVGRRMSTVDAAPDESLMNIDQNNNSNDQEILPFYRVLLTPCILWSFVTMCLTQLRLIMYMGSLEMYFKAASERNFFTEEEELETVEFYILIFGVVQINCFFMAPIIGTIMDWKVGNLENDVANSNANGSASRRNSEAKIVTNGTNGQTNGNATHEKSEKKPKFKKKVTRKLQQIRNLCRAFTTTNTLLMLFGILVLFEKFLELQYVSFILHTIIRTFLHSSVGGLYAVMYHFSHFGKLTGLASFLSALFIFIQAPLFTLTNNVLGGDPFWINFTLLLLTILGYGLPLYLWMCARRLVKEYQAEEEQSGQEEIKQLEMKLMTINEDIENEVDIEKHVELSQDLSSHIGSSTNMLGKNHLTRLVQDEPDVFSSLSAITF